MSVNYTKRIMLYLHFDQDNLIDPHIYYQIKAFQNSGINIIFISNSNIPDADKKNLRTFVSEIIERSNSGFDFGAWKEILLKRNQSFFNEYDELILCNSTCYGPLFPLSDVFHHMNQTPCDFWGMTQHIRTELFPEHLQSYFLVFRHSVLQSEYFWSFWKNLPVPTSLHSAIHNGELALTQYFSSHGFHYVPYVKILEPEKLLALGIEESFSMNCADWLIYKYHLPFLKVKSFRCPPERHWSITREIFKALQFSGSAYPQSLILNHLKRIAPVAWRKRIPGTLELLCPDKENKAGSYPKISVFLNFHTKDMFEFFIKALENIPYKFDLFIVSEIAKDLWFTDSYQKKIESITTAVQIHSCQTRHLQRSWITIFQKISSLHGLALVLQEKNFAEKSEILKWKQYQTLINNLLYNKNTTAQIINIFNSDKKCGLVFSLNSSYLPASSFLDDIASPFQKQSTSTANSSSDSKISDKEFFMFPSSAFWCRAQLLNHSLLESALWNNEDMIPHAIQQAGYSYKIVALEEELIGNFQIYEDWFLSPRVHYEQLSISAVTIRKALFLLGKALLKSYKQNFPRLSSLLLPAEKQIIKTLKTFIYHKKTSL